jgi:diacylglycerol kinase (ATP)
MSGEPLRDGSGRTPALVLLNPRAGGGRARARWGSVEPVLAKTMAPRVVELTPAVGWDAAVREAMAGGIRLFVAAGGDGTVGALVDALVRCADGVPLNTLTVGAVGLGSSNDFHKPFRRLAGDVPVRIGSGRTPRDVCRARFHDGDGVQREHHFVVSASLGLTARANAFFSNGDRVQGWLRARWTGGAILYAAQRSLFTRGNDRAVLRLGDATPLSCAITNLSVAKTRWVSGIFRYDTTVAPDDGLLAVNLCEGMTRTAALRALADLARGRFQGPAGRHHWRTPRLEVELGQPAVLELDGETFQARRVAMDVLPERIAVCT